VKVLCIFGTRPEAIKLAPVVRQLQLEPACDTVRVCVTAQHREMLDQMLDVFHIAVDYDLNLMQEDQSLTALSASILMGLEPVLRAEHPDWVLVQGDTTTAMIAGMAAFYQRVRVGHVEAGLRTRDKWRPFPEEINRRLVDVLCDLHFAPTTTARDNLLDEGVLERTIVVTGNTVVDALQWMVAQPMPASVQNLLPADRRVILVTAHRRENFGAPLDDICRALADLAERYRDEICIVYPVHRNPNIQEPVHRLLAGVPNILLLPPLDYLSLVHLMKRSCLILTDSGGIQEEAPSLGTPVLVLRDITERPEAVEAGAVKVVGTRREAIVREAARLLDDEATYAAMARPVSPYGDGRAAERIVAALGRVTASDR
jgi:UDP-N-acetylglucosamine 2-epimerase (non-hydrolysing)